MLRIVTDGAINPSHPKTSQPSPHQFVDKENAQLGDTILFTSLTVNFGPGTIGLVLYPAE